MTDNTDAAQAADARIRAAALAETLSGIRFAAAMPGLTDCETCAGPIGQERLQANPSARRCIHCQTQFENRLGGRRL